MKLDVSDVLYDSSSVSSDSGASQSSRVSHDFLSSIASAAVLPNNVSTSRNMPEYWSRFLGLPKILVVGYIIRDYVALTIDGSSRAHALRNARDNDALKRLSRLGDVRGASVLVICLAENEFRPFRLDGRGDSLFSFAPITFASDQVSFCHLRNKKLT